MARSSSTSGLHSTEGDGNSILNNLCPSSWVGVAWQSAQAVFSTAHCSKRLTNPENSCMASMETIVKAFIFSHNGWIEAGCTPSSCCAGVVVEHTSVSDCQLAGLLQQPDAGALT